jgi:hypothetical protein
MIITSEQLKQIVGAGGGLVIDASTVALHELRDIVSATTARQASIIVKNVSGLTAAQLKDLATLAPGLVMFDLTP